VIKIRTIRTSVLAFHENNLNFASAVSDLGRVHWMAPTILAALLLLSAPGMTSSALAQKQGREDTPAASAAEEEVVRLRQRVEQLEEQFVDMQVTIGTVESLAGKGGSRRGASAMVGPQMPLNNDFSSDDGRIGTLETQIGALTRQVEILSQRLNGGNGGGAQAGNFGFRQGDGTSQTGPVQQGFGQVTVTPGGGDLQPQSFGQGANSAGAGGLAPRPTNFDNRPPQAIYDEAYKYLLIQDYGAAQTAFDTFIQNHPNGKLAGNAQYWLGESYYVRGQYKDAADSFLKGYTVYAKSTKAPDSLLKLAMSLKRLGQKDAACQTFGELGVRFPQAPDHIKQRARSERRRSGC